MSAPPTTHRRTTRLGLAAAATALALLAGACGTDSSSNANRTTVTSAPGGPATGPSTDGGAGPGPTAIPQVALQLHEVASLDAPALREVGEAMVAVLDATVAELG